MVHSKSDVRKITYCIWEQHLAMYKTSILPPEHMKLLQWSFFKWLLEKETDIALIVVTLWSSMPLLEPPLFFKLAKLGLLMVQTWSTWNLILWKWLTIYRTGTVPCLRPAFCHKNKQNYYSEYLLKWLLEAETHIALTVNPHGPVPYPWAPFCP